MERRRRRPVAESRGGENAPLSPAEDFLDPTPSSPAPWIEAEDAEDIFPGDPYGTPEEDGDFADAEIPPPPPSARPRKLAGIREARGKSPAQDKRGKNAPRGGYAAVVESSSPIHAFGDESPNPAPPRRWPFYLFVLLTALLVFVAINIEQRREDNAHWAGPQASGINQNLVARSSMDAAESLPTAVPQDYRDQMKAAFALTKELPSPTPLITAPPVTDTPQPTKIPLLKKDMQSDLILQMEQRLMELGYLSEEHVNGKFDNNTVRAVKDFQDNNFLTADGMVGAESLELLFPSSAGAPTAAPAPTRKNEPYVWATVNGTYYHSDKNCSNMKGAAEMALSDAKIAGKKPCPKCDPPRGE